VESGATTWSLRLKSLPMLLLAAALIAGIGIRCFDLALEPLSFDEAASVYIAKLPVSEVLEKNGAYNSSPPAMLVLLHFVLKLGDSEAFVRAVSVLSGIAAILAVYQLARHLNPKGYVPAAAALLFALSEQQVLLSRQFRVYALGELFVALGFLAALAFARRPSWIRASLTAILFFLGMQVQYAAGPFFAAVGLAVVCGRDSFGPEWRVRLRQLALVVGASVLGMIAVYQTALSYQMYAGRGTSYAQTLYSPSSPWFEISIAFLIHTWLLIQGGLDLTGMPWSGAVLTLFCLYGAWRLASIRPRDPYLLTACYSVLAFALLSLANLYPYGATRQCLILTLPLYGFAAVGLIDGVSCESKTRRAIAVSLLALVAVGFAVGIPVPHRDTLPDDTADLRDGIRLLQRNWQPGDITFVSPGAFPIFDYYVTRMPIGPWIAAEGWNEWMQDERVWQGLVGSEPPYSDQLDALLRTNNRVWMLYSHYHPGEMTLDELAVRRGWKPHIQTIVRQRGDGGEGNELYLFRR
jgi:hypothetical protein